ncbi:vomeronasal type-2 receptor 26-like [Dendropsophus ebraccatus]|uniref:vomeronasal type-2 receptor 26-like n=1 Tax=Dendropsophus ebraccatus TaxID=150705 RepID=UPI00383120D2
MQKFSLTKHSSEDRVNKVEPVASQPSKNYTRPSMAVSSQRTIKSDPTLYYYKNLMTLFYSVHEINEEPSILPNLTLGYHIYDSCADPRKAIKSILQILSGPKHIVPNYSCTRKKKKVVGFIGDHFSLTTLPIAQLLGIYPYSQISYGATDTLLNDRRLFPSFFRTVPDDYTSYSVISYFLRSFGWTWVGIIAFDDNIGDREASLLTSVLSSHGICVDFIFKGSYWKRQKENYVLKSFEVMMKSSARIIIVCGTFSTIIVTFITDFQLKKHDKILILNPTYSLYFGSARMFNISLLFHLKPGKIPNMESYFKSFHPLRNPNDSILENLWIIMFQCLTGNKEKNDVFERIYKKPLHKCDGAEKIEQVLPPSRGNTFQIYLAVRSLADALHNMYISHGHQSTDHQIHHHTHKMKTIYSDYSNGYDNQNSQLVHVSRQEGFIYREIFDNIKISLVKNGKKLMKVHNYIKAMMCSDESGGERKCFTDQGDKEYLYTVNNATLWNMYNSSLNPMGSYNPGSKDSMDFWFSAQDTIWKNNIRRQLLGIRTQLPSHGAMVAPGTDSWKILNRSPRPGNCLTQECSRSSQNIELELLLNSPWVIPQGSLPNLAQQRLQISHGSQLLLHFPQMPRSQCSESCVPGQKKITTPSIHLCCYECAPCAEGEVSNISDSENCRKCPEDAWSNENRTLCVMKEMEYLSYTEDIISIAFSSLATFFWILTLLLLLIFVSQRDTAIVRANNKNLSFVLLVSIMLSFLSVFLFLGRPVDTTCRIRQISTGILLSISISSLLAKTIMVYMAFRATKPGSVWSRWSGVTLPNCVLLICSSVQGVICMSWVTLSPPFQELDTHSYKEKMVVQCNEGSDLWFYSVLGYMGILAAVSFITAFLARTLPDSFNEAKYITFSMLVFCSVWIAMIPAYLCTKGKYMVAVEIFAILASNAGLLGCIFFPKCYIILLKPELNTRKYILEPKKKIAHY